MARTILSSVNRPAAMPEPTTTVTPLRAPASTAAAPTSASTSDDAQRRLTLIAEAAYYRALQRGFSPGAEMDDWLAAERDIDNSPLTST